MTAGLLGLMHTCTGTPQCPSKLAHLASAVLPSQLASLSNGVCSKVWRSVPAACCMLFAACCLQPECEYQQNFESGIWISLTGTAAQITCCAADPAYKLLHLAVAVLFAQQLQGDMKALESEQSDDKDKANISLAGTRAVTD